MKPFSTTILAFGIVLAALPAARASDTTCSQTSPIPPNSTVNGNLTVPPNATCTLYGAIVTGNVHVQKDAFLVFDPIGYNFTIDGNVQVDVGANIIFSSYPPPQPPGSLAIGGNVEAAQCSGVILESGNSEPVMIGGAVQILRCTDGEGSGVVNAEIGGNFDCSGNSVNCFAIGDNVKGNVQINDSSLAEVSNNTIGGNLECQGNTTITDQGIPNMVSGNKLGQCAHF